MSDENDRDARDDQEIQQKVSFLQVLQGTLAALFGVQSNANRERDFSKGRAGDYIGVFAVLVVLLVITMIVIVNLVLGAAS